MNKPELPNWDDDADVKRYYAEQDALWKAESVRRDKAADKKWSYAGLDAWLTGRNRESRKIARNTYLQRRGEDIAVMFHATDVVTYHPDGTITLDSGDWLTMSTRDRQDTFTPRWLRMCNDMGLTYVTVNKKKPGETGPWAEGKRYRYFDGIRFGPRGGCLNPLTETTQEKIDRERKALDKKIKLYVEGWIDTAVTGQMPLPSGGDCWHCNMFPESQGHGEEEHLIAHMEESYFVPSLLVKAIRAKNYNDPDFVMRYVYGMMANEEGDHFEGTKINVREVRGILRWFMRKHLRRGVGAPKMTRPRTAA